MRILITGASGMLGAALAARWRDGHEVYATGTHQFPGNPAGRYRAFDLRADSYAELMDWARPDVVVHSAAITNVDLCEKDPALAMAVNAEPVRKFLRARPGQRIALVSSDAVFAAGRHLAKESDAPAPANVYGESKLLGEKYLQEAGAGSCALRTTIVGINANPAKRGFAEWIVDAAREGREISLFTDVLFTPISVWDFADGLERALELGLSGPVHLSGGEIASKHAFGLALCRRLGLDVSGLKAGSLDGLAAAARRTKDQTLDSSRFAALSGRPSPTIAETVAGLAAHFEERIHERV